MPNNILLKRFLPVPDIGFIRSAVTVRPEPVVEIGNFSSSVASTLLTQSLKLVYIPSTSACAIIAELFELAFSHCMVSYPNSKTYLRRLYANEFTDVFPICLTGLAGVGKSQLLKALHRVMPVDGIFSPGSGVLDMPYTSMWEITAKDKKGIIPLLTQFLPSEMQSAERRKTVDQVLTFCRKKAYREGVSLVAADELQFFTRGDASIKLTEALFYLSTLGVPMLYAANFSMVHRVLGRPQQDRQRLMASPRVLLPELLEEKSWYEYVEECVRVSGGAIGGGISELCERLHTYTAGLKRLCVSLIAMSYRLARLKGRYEMNVSDLEQAFKSLEYSANRLDVEIISRQYVTGKCERADLWCPLIAPPPALLAFTESSRLKRDEVVSDRLLRSSLTMNEQRSVKIIENSRTVGGGVKDSIVTLKTKRKELTVDSLSASLHRLIDGKPKK